MPKYTTRLEDDWNKGQNSDDALADALGVEPMRKEVTIHSPVVVDNCETDDEKHNEVRQNLLKIVETGEYALQDLAGVAASSQHPRAYEVLGQIMKTLVDTNSKILEIEKLRSEIKNMKGEKETSKGTINNNLIVGSTEEALELLAKQKEKSNE